MLPLLQECALFAALGASTAFSLVVVPLMLVEKMLGVELFRL